MGGNGRGGGRYQGANPFAQRQRNFVQGESSGSGAWEESGNERFHEAQGEGGSAMVVLGIFTVALAMSIQYVELTHHNTHAKVDTRIVFQGVVVTVEGIGRPLSKIMVVFVVIEEWIKNFCNRPCGLWWRRSLQQHRNQYLLLIHLR
jgi:hypothetical protein